ncbi:hypothetical protein SXCC_00815 [Gluconacetobacter sp. SXCC-1]|nr:hypothetical protein SXCC_00815 [Gluconacetobacter sp. SXCC-1]
MKFPAYKFRLFNIMDASLQICLGFSLVHGRFKCNGMIDLRFSKNFCETEYQNAGQKTDEHSANK